MKSACIFLIIFCASVLAEDLVVDGTIRNYNLTTLSTSISFTTLVKNNNFVNITIIAVGALYVQKPNYGGSYDISAGLTKSFTLTSCGDQSLSFGVESQVYGATVAFGISAIYVPSSLSLGNSISVPTSISASDYFTITAPVDCSNISMMITSDGSYLDITSDDSVVCGSNKRSSELSARHSDVCADLAIDLQDDSRINQDSSSNDVTIVTYNCVDAGNYPFKIRYPNTPYTIQVANGVNSDCSSSNKCNGNGVCFSGKCVCRSPFTGTTCSSFLSDSSFKLSTLGVNLVPKSQNYYFQFSASQIGNKNLVMQYSQTSIGYLYYGSFSQRYGYPNSYVEIPNVYATGLFLLNSNPYGTGASINFTLVDRTIGAIPSTVSLDFGFQKTSSSRAMIYYNVAGSVITGSSLIASLSNPSSNNASASGSYSNTAPNVEIFEATAAPDSLLSGLTQPYEPSSQIILSSINKSANYIIKVASTNFPDMTLSVTTTAGSCAGKCKYGVCNSDGSCSCFAGVTGGLCDTLGQSLAVNTKTKITATPGFVNNFYFNNADGKPFSIYGSSGVSDINVYKYNVKTGAFTNFRANSQPVCDSENGSPDYQRPTGILFIQATTSSTSSNEYIYVQLDNPVVTLGATTTVNFADIGFEPSSRYVRVFEVQTTNSQQIDVSIIAPSGTNLKDKIHIYVNDNCNQYGSSDIDNKSANTATATITQTCSNTVSQFVVIQLQPPALSLDITFTASTPKTCPNCCSGAGYCNLTTYTCSCSAFYTGADCGTPACSAVSSKFCGTLQSGSVSPTLSATIALRGGSSCAASKIIDAADQYVANIFSSSIGDISDKCLSSLQTVYCSIFLPSCSNGKVVRPCSDLCRQYIDACAPPQDAASYGDEICNYLYDQFFTPYWNNTASTCVNPTSGTVLTAGATGAATGDVTGAATGGATASVTGNEVNSAIHACVSLAMMLGLLALGF